MSDKRKIQKWRWSAEIFLAAILLGLPFLKINGESALRFDIPTLRLHFFGTQLWVEEFFIVLAFTLFLTFFIVLITILFGRIWCGWLCPQTVIIDFTRFYDNTQKKSLAYKIMAHVFVFLVSALIAADLIWFFVSPYEFFSRLVNSDFGSVLWGFWIVLTLLTFVQFTLVRRKFCSTVCPYAKLQDVLFDNKTLLVAFNRERQNECLNCKACTKICPVRIDIRQGFNATCINCARCVDECSVRMGRKSKKSLISYVFGSHSDTSSLIRTNVVVVTVVTVIFLGLSLYLTNTRKGFDFSIIQNYNLKPQIVNNKVINAYTLKLKNMQRKPVNVSLDVTGIENIRFVKKESVHVKGGETKGVTVLVQAPFSEHSTKASLITIFAHIGDLITVEKQVNFLLPFE